MVVPIVGLVGVGIVTYGNVHPLPPSPLRYFIWATVASWSRRNLPLPGAAQPREADHAGQLFAAATPEEADVRDDMPPFLPDQKEPA